MLISHSKPTISPRDIQQVKEVLQSGFLAQGQKVSQFEEALARFTRVKGAVAVHSGTSALHLALMALKITPGDQVIVPSFVCTALLNAVYYVRATPKVVDVRADDFNICPQMVKKAINRRTKAIIVPHMFGAPAAMKEILALGIPVIEDCAQSLGAKDGHRPVGSQGLLSICSFYATKMMTTGEGGAVLSQDKNLLSQIRDLRDYDNKLDYQIRFNYKMSDFQAALGISQLSQLPRFIAKRQQIARSYDDILADKRIELPHYQRQAPSVYFRYVIKTAGRCQPVMQKLRKAGIEACLPVFKPLHQYLKAANCPVSDALMSQCLSIPLYPSLSQGQINHIRKHLKEI